MAEAALRGIVRKARTRQMSDLSDEQEPDGTPVTLSPPDIRSIDGADWYVWLGEGGACDADGTPLLLDQQFSALDTT